MDSKIVLFAVLILVAIFVVFTPMVRLLLNIQSSSDVKKHKNGSHEGKECHYS